MPDMLTTAEIKIAIGVKTVEQVDRWAAKWGLAPCSPPGTRPRLYRRSDFLEAYRREHKGDAWPGI